jgi:HEAT repeat protein
MRRFFNLATVLLVLLLLTACGPSSESRRIIKGLRSRSVAERLKAVAEAQAQPRADAALRKELLRMFEEEREVAIVRGCAGMTLGSLHDPRVVPAVLKRLPNSILNIGKPSRPQDLDAYLLSKALQAYGPDSLQPLSALLRDPRKEVACWIIMHHAFYRHNDRAFDVLAHYADDRDVFLRQAASFGLSLFAHKRAEELVLRHIADPDAEVRYNLARALFNYGTSRGIRPVETQLAKEKDPRVREQLTKALAAIKTRPGAPAQAPLPRNPPPRSGGMFRRIAENESATSSWS